jgi:hypothetical protein
MATDDIFPSKYGDFFHFFLKGIFLHFVMPVHGFIHDDQLQACPCVVLGLMYGLKRLYAIRYLGF